MPSRAFRYLLLVVIAVLQARALSAADTVTVRTKEGRERRVSGEIVDFVGGQLRLKLSSGRVEEHPATSIVQIDSEWLPSQLEAEKRFDQNQFDAALELFQKTQAAEPRNWVKRRILARVVSCYRHLNQWNKAGEMFAILCEDDPQTPYVDCIPLSWSAMNPQPMQMELARKRASDVAKPLTALVAGSWLLSMGDRSASVAVLESLSRHEDPRIAHLAAAQLWRTRVVTASQDDALRWARQIERMPEELRGGPYYLLGQLWSRHGRHEDAALAFLRTPILLRGDRILAADSLMAAGRELEALGQKDEAANLFREVSESYAFTDAAELARRRLSNP